jgi:hypothetical protein
MEALAAEALETLANISNYLLCASLRTRTVRPTSLLPGSSASAASLRAVGPPASQEVNNQGALVLVKDTELRARITCRRASPCCA